MNYRLLIVLFLFFLLSSCNEDVSLSSSNEVYVSVTSKGDSIIVLFTDDSDTLLRKGTEIYDRSGRLFMTTLKDTVLNLDNGKATRWIKRSKDNGSEYTSTTYTGICLVERQNVKTYTFDGNGNIIKIRIPSYYINYVADKYVMPVKQNTTTTNYYYPNSEKTNKYTIKYQNDFILIKSKYTLDETFHYVDGEVYAADGKLFLSNKKDTTIVWGAPSSPLEGYPTKCEIRIARGNSSEHSAKYYINPDTAFRLTSEFIYDNDYRIKMIRQTSTVEFIQK